MKNRKVTALIIILAIVAAYFVVRYAYVREMIVEPSRGTAVRTFDELVEESDIIIQGRILPFKTNKLIRAGTRWVVFGYTKTDVRVERVLKGSCDDEKITITEDYWYQNAIIGRKLMLQGAYLPAKVGSSYILFLRKYSDEVTYAGMYYPIDLEYGKYLVNDKTADGIDGMSNSELQVGDRVQPRYFEWMKQVMDKYGE